MEFNSRLLSTEGLEPLSFDLSYKGLYSTMQFVLRLNPDIRKSLNQETEMSPEKIQAFSTYLHENIHWWQHIGSNFGFILNLSYPSYAINSYAHLKTLVNKGVKYKSLIKYETQYYEQKGISNIDELNIIINNFHDLEYGKQFSLDNKIIDSIIKDRRFFLSMGHCYHVLWSLPIAILSELFDKDFHFMPKINEWISNFERLEQENIEGFYPDSDYHIAPIGIKAIYEGQAIFNQILYLKNAFKENNIIFKDFIDNGMLHGIYLEAFNYFLEMIGEERPFFVDESIIGMFLLICDLSINPNNGFPDDIYDYENFIHKNNPGVRFILFCKITASYKKNLIPLCKSLSKETYILLSKFLSKKFGCKCPYQSIKKTLLWLNHESINTLLEEEAKHCYKEENMPFRLFLAKYLKFQQDKLENPHIFCWIGHYIPNAESEKVMELFEKHRALFTDSDDGEIKPIIFKDVSEDDMYKTFNSFYQHTVLYELISKWITEEGEFKFDYKWLFNNRNDENISSIKKAFKSHFDIEIEDVKVI